MTAANMAAASAFQQAGAVVAVFTMTADSVGGTSGYDTQDETFGSLSDAEAYRGVTIQTFMFDTGSPDTFVMFFDCPLPGNFYHTIHIEGLNWDETFLIGQILNDGGTGEFDINTNQGNTRIAYATSIDGHAVFTDTEVYTITITSMPLVPLERSFVAGVNGDDTGFMHPSFGNIGSMADPSFFGTEISGQGFTGLRFDAGPDEFRVSFNANLGSSGQQQIDFFHAVTITGDAWSERLLASDASVTKGTLMTWDWTLTSHAVLTNTETYTVSFEMVAPNVFETVVGAEDVGGAVDGYEAGNAGTIDDDSLGSATIIEVVFDAMTDELDLVLNSEEVQGFISTLSLVGAGFSVVCSAQQTSLYAAAGGETRWRWDVESESALTVSDYALIIEYEG